MRDVDVFIDEEDSVSADGKPEPRVKHGEEGNVGYGKRSDTDSEKKKIRNEKKETKEEKVRMAKEHIARLMDGNTKWGEEEARKWKDGYFLWVYGSLSSGHPDLAGENTHKEGENKMVHNDTGIYETCVDSADRGKLLGKLYTRLDEHLREWKLLVGKDITDVSSVESKGEEILAEFRTRQNEELHEEFEKAVNMKDSRVESN